MQKNVGTDIHCIQHRTDCRLVHIHDNTLAPCMWPMIAIVELLAKVAFDFDRACGTHLNSSLYMFVVLKRFCLYNETLPHQSVHRLLQDITTTVPEEDRTGTPIFLSDILIRASMEFSISIGGSHYCPACKVSVFASSGICIVTQLIFQALPTTLSPCCCCTENIATANAKLMTDRCETLRGLPLVARRSRRSA